MRIGVLTEHDIAAWAADEARGARPARSPYLVDHLERMGHELVQLRPVGIPDRWAHKVEHRLGYGVRSALDIRTARTCDVVLGLLETEAWAYSRLRGPLRLPPLVTLECWLSDDLRQASGGTRAALVRRARRLGDILTLSENQVRILREAGLPAERLHHIPFAVATEYFTPSPQDAADPVLPGPHDVLFVGQDRGRDLSTFLDAMGRLDGRHRALLVTKPHLLGGRALPANVTVHGPVDHREYRDLLRAAPVTVVPTFALAYPTGQSVALEAAAVGSPVVVTDTPAMREYVRPGEEALMPPVGDAAALAEAIAQTLADDTATRARAAAFHARVLEKNTAAQMWGAAEPVLRDAARR